MQISTSLFFNNIKSNKVVFFFPDSQCYISYIVIQQEKNKYKQLKCLPPLPAPVSIVTCKLSLWALRLDTYHNSKLLRFTEVIILILQLCQLIEYLLLRKMFYKVLKGNKSITVQYFINRIIKDKLTTMKVINQYSG